MGKCLECLISACDKRERCQDCHKGPLCFQHRFDHSVLLDWGDTDSQEYKCRDCENSYRARLKREDEARSAARTKQLKMEALYEEHERRERLEKETKDREALAKADDKLSEWTKSNPQWLAEHQKAFFTAEESRRNKEWEAREAALVDAKRREFIST